MAILRAWPAGWRLADGNTKIHLYVHLFIESNMLLSIFKKSWMVKLKNINNAVMISSLIAIPGNKRKYAMNRTDIEFTIVEMKRKNLNLRKRAVCFWLLIISILILATMNETSTQISTLSTASIIFLSG
ncbi:MAG: hypothetical protein H8E41_10355 [Desulfobulbaceae bacterium]|uniref:Uncharacterized protein n=1 Tax=Candidatus Desulfobia pelagia TaxID=2841692 RepID=A0A8J6NCT2_9BACT|nr:hypothetical protein [Candidatus Desulfobia pelagia]